MRTRIEARAVVYDQEQDRILLVRNRGADYWYIPGGGWEFESENILECAKREVKEETGLDVMIGKFLYLQEFHPSEDLVYFESFWLAKVVGSDVLDRDHVDTDPDGAVGEARWFTRQELSGIALYPERFKTTFWENIADIIGDEDRFIGVRSKET